MGDQQENATKSRAAAKRQLDRWHLRPVAPGWVRGNVINLRQTSEITEYGELRVLEFNLERGPDTAPVPVRMMGTDFSHHVWEGLLLDIADPDPSVRPLEPHVAKMPRGSGDDLVAYYPMRFDIPRSRWRVYSALIVGLPLLVILGLLAWIMVTFDL